MSRREVHQKVQFTHILIVLFEIYALNLCFVDEQDTDEEDGAWEKRKKGRVTFSIYIHTYILYIHTYMHICTHACIHISYLHIYILTYLRAYIHLTVDLLVTT